MTNASHLIGALADPTRSALVEALRGGPRSVTELADRVPVSRSAVSQHLAVLRDAGVVDRTPLGTRRVYRLRPETLGALREYVDALWGDALDGYAAAAESAGAESVGAESVGAESVGAEPVGAEPVGAEPVGEAGLHESHGWPAPATREAAS
jgi:DNA-binding transcriptional ArsR family regulator